MINACYPDALGLWMVAREVTLKAIHCPAGGSGGHGVVSSGPTAWWGKSDEGEGRRWRPSPSVSPPPPHAGGSVITYL